jgi:pimeloyl-ACP methyl ester carboxylesterase
MTPVFVAEQMAAAIPGAALFIVPNGTHYTIAEYPEIVNLRLERFFRDHLPGVKLD